LGEGDLIPTGEWWTTFSTARSSARICSALIRFLNTVDARVPAGKLIHPVVDNYATWRCGGADKFSE
jgi:hypothetical protein